VGNFILDGDDGNDSEVATFEVTGQNSIFRADAIILGGGAHDGDDTGEGAGNAQVTVEDHATLYADNVYVGFSGTESSTFSVNSGAAAYIETKLESDSGFGTVVVDSAYLQVADMAGGICLGPDQGHAGILEIVGSGVVSTSRLYGNGTLYM